MAQETILDILYKYAETVAEKYSYRRLFLFGSYARGDFHKDSDIDIAIVFDDFEDRMDRQVALMRLTHNIDSRIEPHPFRERDFTLEDPLVYEILQFGQEIKKQPV